MKNWIIFILILFIYNTTKAQDSCSTSCDNLKHGIQFQIRSLSLMNFNSYTLAYRYLFSNNSGLRIGILTRINDEELDMVQKEDSVNYNTPSTTKYYNLKLSVQYIKSILNFEKFTLIAGIGPFIGYTETEYSHNRVNSDYQRISKESRKGFNYGIDLLLGTEYKLHKNLLLSGEYGISFLFEKLEIESLNRQASKDGETIANYNETGKSNKLNIDGIGVALGISIFF